MIRVTVPASSANVGPGFDALAIALELRDEIVVDVTASKGVTVTIEGEGADSLPRDERNLVVRAMHVALAAYGAGNSDGELPGVSVHCINRIPQSRGLGSSAAAIVGGMAAARAIADTESTAGANGTVGANEKLLQLAATMEGHADNVAACLYGGLTLAWLPSPVSFGFLWGYPRVDPTKIRNSQGKGGEGKPVRVARIPLDNPPRLVAYVPNQVMSTKQARGALPEVVPHKDAAANAGRAALLIHALQSAPELLFDATTDALHQPYRAPLMPESAKLIDALRSEGIPAVLSGAGPTVLAFQPHSGEKRHVSVCEGITTSAIDSLPEATSFVSIPLTMANPGVTVETH